MKRALNILLVSFLFFGGVTLQYGCSTTEDFVQEEQVDTDDDGLTDAQEEDLGTDPENADTDGDGLTDGEEVNEYGTDPLEADTDGDGLEDGEEVNSHDTDPLNEDTDDDGLTDGEEINEYRTNPLEADTDGDGLNDYEEVMDLDTDPNNEDTDGDGFTDGDEVNEINSDPLDPEDPAYIRDGDLGTIHFEFDKSDLDEESTRILEENVELLTNASNFEVRIDAYTDHVGGDQYNQRLSNRRATTVTNFYIDNGIDEDRIESRGLGKAPQPCMDDTDEIGCRENRRAESHPISPFNITPNR